MTTLAAAVDYYTASQFGGFKKFTVGGDLIDRLVDSLRFAWNSLVAQNDAEPENDAAKLMTMVIWVTGVSYVLILLGLFGSKLIDAGEAARDRANAPEREEVSSIEREAITAKEKQLSSRRRIGGAFGMLATFLWLIFRSKLGI